MLGCDNQFEVGRLTFAKDTYQKLYRLNTYLRATNQHCVGLNMYDYSFQRLRVWQNARKLNLTVYRITKEFPKSEQYGLTNQLRRASVSISSNIAEGSGRFSIKDQSNFYRIAYASTLEVLSQMYLSLDLNLIDEEVFKNEVLKQIEAVSKPLYAMANRK